MFRRKDKDNKMVGDHVVEASDVNDLDSQIEDQASQREDQVDQIMDRQEDEIDKMPTTSL